MLLPVPQARLVPLAGVLSAPGPPVADVPHDALIGGEPREASSRESRQGATSSRAVVRACMQPSVKGATPRAVATSSRTSR
jgi:hypothetical protein